MLSPSRLPKGSGRGFFLVGRMKKKEFALYVTPSLVVMSLVILVPLVFIVYLSFQDIRLGARTASFIGFENYAKSLSNPRFWNALKNTLMYVGISVPSQVVIGFIVAMLLNRVTRFKGFLVGSSLLPHILTPVVAALLVSWLFRSQLGFYTHLLEQIGITIEWYADRTAAKFLLIIYEIWKNTPFAVLVLYAGLRSLPVDPFEAAIVDGAGWWQRLWHITIPILAPLFIFVALMRTMDAYRIFDNVFVMTGGGPGTATELMTYYNYVVAFNQLDLGRGSALGVLTVLGILILLGPLVYRVYRNQLGGR